MNKAILRNDYVILYCSCGGFDHQLRLVSLWDDEYGIEVISPFNVGFFNRLKRALQYIFCGQNLYSFDMVLKEKDVKALIKHANKFLRDHKTK